MIVGFRFWWFSPPLPLFVHVDGIHASFPQFPTVCLWGFILGLKGRFFSSFASLGLLTKVFTLWEAPPVPPRLTPHVVSHRSLWTDSREQQLLAGFTRAHVKRFNPNNSLFHSSLPPLSFPKKLELFAMFECQKGLLSLWELRQTC